METIKKIGRYTAGVVLSTFLAGAVPVFGTIATQEQEMYQLKQFQERNRLKKVIVNDDLVNKISKIESNGNPKARSNKKARGLMQITPIVLKEWNILHPNKMYNLNDLFKPKINKKIGIWYLNRIKDIYLPSSNLYPTIDNILAAYNFGIDNLEGVGDARENFSELPKETRNYLNKFYRMNGQVKF